VIKSPTVLLSFQCENSLTRSSGIGVSVVCDPHLYAALKSWVHIFGLHVKILPATRSGFSIVGKVFIRQWEFGIPVAPALGTENHFGCAVRPRTHGIAVGSILSLLHSNTHTHKWS
jgi:hypothetical protein